MNLLLDTHILLWWLDDPTLISSEAQTLIREETNIIYVSSASVWEIVIKKALGKLDAPDNLPEMIDVCRFTPLPITVAHAMGVQSLSHHHRDPFDRMLIAQAITEGLTIISRDSYISSYPVPYILG
jgi:PIN domain nuclease of toxin-antitoxin system